MEGRIGQLRARYRVIGDGAPAARVAARVERLGPDELAQAYTAALDEALGVGPAVYVLRRVHADLCVGADAGDADLTRRVGERLAGAVVATLASDAEEGDNVARFADQSEFVARFIVDLLAGTAWGRWYYGAFAALRPLDRRLALHRLLLEQREHAAAIFAHLHRWHALDGLLDGLDADTVRELRAVAPEPVALVDGTSWRPLFARAAQLLGSLELLVSSAESVEAMLARFCSGSAPAPDWSTRAGLTAAFIDVLRFIARRAGVRRLSDRDRAAVALRLDRALDAFDWLDTGELRSTLLDLLAADDESRPLPTRPSEGDATARQRKLLDALRAVLHGPNVLARLERGDATAVLQIHAALVAAAPEWAHDPTTLGLIELIVEASSHLRRTPDPLECLRRLRRGDIEGAVDLLPAGVRGAGRPAMQRAGTLGQAALEAIAVVVHPAGSPVAARDLGIASECAGVLLLARAVADSRLPALVDEVKYPPGIAHLIAALAMRWSGAAAPGGTLDSSIAALSGLGESRSVEDVRARWSTCTAEDHAGFQRALLRTLFAQRVCTGSILRVFRAEVAPGSSALIGGDESGALWPLGEIVAGTTSVIEVANRWIECWEDATGGPPSAVVSDVPELAAWSTPRPTNDRESDARLRPPVAFEEALGAVDGGLLRLPGADLAIALIALALLRVWARWLPSFGASSAPFVLAQLIRRPGRISVAEDAIDVTLDRRPLDIVLEMAGYMAPLERVSWLGNRALRFHLRAA